MIHVTKSYLPPKEEYIQYLDKIWESNWLTNNGPLVKELENKLKKFTKTEHLFFVSNGTIAIQLAIKAMELKGKIITTPYSYVATTTAILWEGCEPVFVDIDPKTCCINADLIEEQIDEQTVAILATHVYGHPCDVEKIESIAQKHNLKIIYDAAHTFGAKYKGKDIMTYGHAATTSFHATKVFHTVEGGLVIAKEEKIARKVDLYRAFGHKGEEDYFSMGINGKNSEFHAAMGLCNLPRIDQFIALRKERCDLYDSILLDTSIIRPIINENVDFNYAYYPIIFENEAQLVQVRAALNANQINPRRYFYPSLNKLPYLKTYYPCPVSESYANRVLCLPLYIDLSLEKVQEIATIISKNI